MTQTETPRRLTAKQLAKALAEIDAQLAGLQIVLDTFAATFTSDIPEPVYDAWNAVQAAVTALEFHRVEVERNPKPLTGNDLELWKLVQQNID